MEWILRFAIGGVIVSAFALLADIIRPKGFAGLFGAAPSVALATLSLTIATDGAAVAKIEARSMIAGALAFAVYAMFCVYLMAIRRWPATRSTLIAMIAWLAVSGLALWMG